MEIAKIAKIQKLERPKISRFHAHPKLFKSIQKLFKYIFDSYVVGSSTIIQDLLRFHHRVFCFYLTRSDIPIVYWTHHNLEIQSWKNYLFEKWCLVVVYNISELLFPKRWDMYKSDCLKMFGDFLYFLKYFGNKKGWKGQYVVNILEVPKCSKNIAIHPQA